MKITRLLVFVFLVAAANGLLAWLTNLPQDAGPDVPDGKISSFSFAPFREGQSPLAEIFPAHDEIDEDLRMLADKTHTIRTYASLGGLKDVPALARKHGIKMIQGAWLGYVTMEKENNAEVQQLIKAANDYPDVIDRVIVGNEVLLRGELQPEQLLQFIRKVKQSVKQPVSYADVWSFYMQHPEIAKEVDFITVHILPYWEDEPLNVEQAAAHIERIYQKIHTAYPGKPILIGESGWPSAGRQRGPAIPSVVNEAKFIRALVQVANKNGFDYNIVEAFNQPWKSKLEGVVGANWGIFSAGREAVFPLTGKVTENPHWWQEVLWAAALVVLAAALYARRSAPLSTPRLLAWLAFTQLLAALLANQAGDLCYTSYSDLQRTQSAIIIAMSAALAAMIVRRALDLLRGESSNPALAAGLHYLFLAFAALAFYKALGLALNGRYLSIPYPLNCIAVAGALGLASIRYVTETTSLSDALAFSGLTGAIPLRRRDSTLSRILLAAGLAVIAAETAIIMSWPEYQAAYPLLSDLMWGAFMYTTTQSQMFGWIMIIGAAVIILPSRITGYLLAFMIAAVIYGETNALASGHDFIDAYPQAGARIRQAFIYTITNTQMLLWLASLAILALMLTLRARKHPQ